MNENKSLSKSECDELFDEIQKAINRWSEGRNPVKHNNIELSLKEYLREFLRQSSFKGFEESIEIPKYNHLYDVVVADRIAIKTIKELHDGLKEWIHKQLRYILNDYNYLIIYGHQISSEYTDLWRQIKRSLTRNSEENNIHVIGTIDRNEYAIPLTKYSVPATILRRFGIYGMFFLFVLTGCIFLESASQGNHMGRWFITVVIVFNIVVISMAAFLVRYL